MGSYLLGFEKSAIRSQFQPTMITIFSQIKAHSIRLESIWAHQMGPKPIGLWILLTTVQIRAQHSGLDYIGIWKHHINSIWAHCDSCFSTESERIRWGSNPSGFENSDNRSQFEPTMNTIFQQKSRLIRRGSNFSGFENIILSQF